MRAVLGSTASALDDLLAGTPPSGAWPPAPTSLAAVPSTPANPPPMSRHSLWESNEGYEGRERCSGFSDAGCLALLVSYEAWHCGEALAAVG